MTQKACLPSGYKYKYEGKRNWKRSSDERWEIVMRGAVCGTKLGTRTIDGAHVTVVRVKSRQNERPGHPRGIYAAMHTKRIPGFGRRR